MIHFNAKIFLGACLQTPYMVYASHITVQINFGETDLNKLEKINLIRKSSHMYAHGTLLESIKVSL